MSGTVRRHSVRALLMDPDDGAVLLMRLRFAAWRRDHWLTPGGGIDEGETPEAALRREIREEVGLCIDDEVGAPVWTRRIRFEFDGVDYDQSEYFYVVPTARFEPSADANPVDHEVEALRGYGWWTHDAMRASSESFIPAGFADHLAPIVAGERPAQPIDVGR